ncbi:MAG: DUF368 domain-containing protein [Bacilli bacterium]|nr:DUF368 domain-containing protein [Bacilli bacterium]
MFNRFIKGFILGISEGIPGFCSAILAMFLGVYEELLEVISGFYKVKILLKNLPFLIGMLLGLITIVIGMAYIINQAEDILKLFFLGLMISGLFNLKKKVNFKNNEKNWIFLFGILFSILPEIMPQGSTSNNYLLIIIGGLISALGFILPGISGSLILLTMGIYPTIINSLSNVFKIFVKLPMNADLIISLLFLISFVLGAIVFSKLIKRFIQKKENMFLKFCMGLILGSTLIMLIECYYLSINVFIKIILIMFGILIMNFFKER